MTCYQCNGAGKGGPAHGRAFDQWQCSSCKGEGYHLSYATVITSVACPKCQ